jgi:hypothetical protein
MINETISEIVSGNNLYLTFGIIAFLNLMVFYVISYIIVPILLLFKLNILIENYETKNKTKLLIITDINRKFHWTNIKKYYKPDLVILDMDDYDNLINFIYSLNNDITTSIDVVICSQGGSVCSNNYYLFLIKELKSQYTINTYVYKYAMSAAALLFLSGDNLYMDDYDFISPTDPQIPFSDLDEDYYQSADILNINKDQISFKDQIVYNSIKRYNTENIQMVRSLLKTHVKSNKQFKKIVNILSDGKILHATPLGVSYLISHGLNIKKIPFEIERLSEKIFEYI